jgi:hypothetical protein
MKQYWIQEQIEFVKKMLRSGYSVQQIHQAAKKKWKDINSRQIGYRIVAANKQLLAEQRQIAEQTQLIVNKTITERVFDIISLVERKQVLSQIAQGTLVIPKAVLVDGVIQYVDTYPDFKQRIAAIAELNKIEGSYAPLRADITTNGQEIVPVTAAVIHIEGDKVELLQ